MNNYKIEKNDIILKDLCHFDPVHTFECGQCFRWNKLNDSHWSCVVKGIGIELEWNGKDLIFHNTSEEEYKSIWFQYFDFGRDYGIIKETLSRNDPIMAEAIRFGHGIRLLKQDFNEMLISFLISQNNGIPRIKKIIGSISKTFGEATADLRDYSFPSIERLAALSLEDLKIIKAGYRDKYILRASQQIFNKEVDLNTIINGNTYMARKEMLKLFGVGEKVADCILLFSGTRYDIFPVDRWVKRVMAELYLGYEADYDELYAFAQQKYGELSGFAQQYLFYYAREKKIGLKSEAL